MPQPHTGIAMAAIQPTGPCARPIQSCRRPMADRPPDGEPPIKPEVPPAMNGLPQGFDRLPTDNQSPLTPNPQPGTGADPPPSLGSVETSRIFPTSGQKRVLPHVRSQLEHRSLRRRRTFRPAWAQGFDDFHQRHPALEGIGGRLGAIELAGLANQYRFARQLRHRAGCFGRGVHQAAPVGRTGQSIP